jgi:hypothetical protein
MGLDITNLQTWKDGAIVVMGAPHIVVPLLFAAATCAWWLKGKIDEGKLETHEAQLKLKDEHLQLKEDQLKILQDKLSDLEARQGAGRPKLGGSDDKPPKDTRPRDPDLEGRPEPEWKIFMSTANVFQADAPFEGKTGIFLYASILNTGTPSVIAEWTLSILPHQGFPVVLPPPRTIADRVRLSGDAAIINGSDSLIEKVKNKSNCTQTCGRVATFYYRSEQGFGC